MSDFSSLLGGIIKSNNLSVYSLARDIQCGRTWLQKIVSGERHIDFKNFMSLYNILANYVESTSLWYLYENFALDYFGQKEYHIISYIKSRLSETKELSDYIKEKQDKEFCIDEYLLDHSGAEIGDNERALAVSICKTILSEIEQSRINGHNPILYIKIPSNWKHIKNMILIILNETNIRNNENFKYVVNSQFDHEAELTQIENFLTATEFASYGYNVYKSMVSSDVQKMEDTIFPYYIITGSKITLITDDGRAFVESVDTELMRKISLKFEKIVSGRESFLQNLNADMYSSVVLDRNISAIDDFFEISNRINVSKFYTKDLLRQIMPLEYLDRDFMIETLDMFYRKIRNSKTSMYFNINSIRHFMESDETKNEGGYFNLKFTPDIKIEILKSALEYYENSESEIHMLKSNQYLASDNIYIFGWSEKIICITNYLHCKDKNVDAMAVIDSPGISRHMSNYNTYMMNSHICLDKNSSLVVLKNIIKSYETDFE